MLLACLWYRRVNNATKQGFISSFVRTIQDTCTLVVHISATVRFVYDCFTWSYVITLCLLFFVLVCWHWRASERYNKENYELVTSARRFFWNKSLNRSAPQAKFLKKCFKTVDFWLYKQATKSGKLAKFLVTKSTFQFRKFPKSRIFKEGGSPPGRGPGLYWTQMFQLIFLT